MSGVPSSKAAIAKTLHKVAEMGVHLALDDFGTGFSNLGYLKHFPFDRIKIDKSFVHDIGAAANADAIVKAIIALARSLGMSVTAEGVETELQLAFLRHNTCDEAQGYLLARPKSVSELEQAFSASASSRADNRSHQHAPDHLRPFGPLHRVGAGMAGNGPAP
ncbi:MAG: EAL domain-containing protein [Pseudomonadota bacterium]|nr:EAL domain-containing protein [Pseudomonadota bacterium]